jgi:hypothetical protein
MRPKGPSGNKVGHRLSLEKVHAIIQERPLGKLPRVRLPGPDIKAALKQSGEHYRTTMALKLDDILSREGMGARKVDHEAFVEGVPRAIAQTPIVRIARPQRASAAKLEAYR